MDRTGAASPHDATRLSVVVIGAGPAGLTAAYELMQRGVAATILEADDVVGGISRTVVRDGYRFDLGGHRFFTKVQVVDDLWFEILGADEFLRRPRMSRVYYRGKLYDYPLRAVNVLRNLGPVEAVRCMSSYFWTRYVRRPSDVSTLEGYVVSNYGWRLYRHFFNTYSEKVWGVPASEISADWGAQRIKGMSIWDAAKDALTPKFVKARRAKSSQITSLIEEFNYPKYGPGQMWERCAEIVTSRGAALEFDRRVTRITRDADGATSVTAVDGAGTEHVHPCTHVISSMPFGALVRAMDPPAPDEVIAAADGLGYRNHLTVALVLPQEYSFPDNWIYVHDPEVEVGRIQNFGSWSPYMVQEGRTCLGLEYFMSESDETWRRPDDELIAQAKREIQMLGLADASRVEAAYVARMPKAYPVYDEHYADNVEVLRKWLTVNVPNVLPTGRNGMHRYNNQDHSMLTAMLSVDNIFGAEHDIWAVNVEAEYHEEKAASPSPNGRSGSGRDAPIIPRAALDARAGNAR